MKEIVIGAVIVIVLIVVSAVLISKKKKKSTVNLADQQLLVEVFDAEFAKKWFTEKCNGDTQGKQLFLSYLSDELQKKMKISFAGMDPEHYIIIALLNNNDIAEYQFVNFDSVEPKLRQLLDNNGGKIVFKD